MADPTLQPDQDDSLSFSMGSGGTLSSHRQSLRAAEPQEVTEADAEKT
jgi:hypothetical protein